MVREGFTLMDTTSLKALQKISYDLIEKSTLINASEITINKAGTFLDRVERFLSEVKNPYIMQCGKTIVEVEFSDSDKTIESQIKNYLKSLKTG